MSTNQILIYAEKVLKNKFSYVFATFGYISLSKVYLR